MPRGIENRIQALETRQARRLGFRVFHQDTENPAHYYEGTGPGCIAQGLGSLGPFTHADIDQLRAQGWACIVICYGEQVIAHLPRSLWATFPYPLT